MMEKGFVFNSYIKHLLQNNKDLLKDHLGSLRFDVWFLYNYNANRPILSANQTTFSDAVNNTQYEYLGVLHKTNIETISDVDGLESEVTYEGLFDTPVSAYLFSTPDKPHEGTMIERDIYYKSYNYSTYLAKQYDYSIEKYPNAVPVSEKQFYTDQMNHFNTTYDFSSGYNASDYRVYSINEEPVCESQSNIKTDDMTFTGTIPGFYGNGILITWYDGNRAEKYNNENMIENQPINPENSIPCAYYKLPMTYNPHLNKIKIQWSDDGLFSVK